jgi:hypothetical protein
MKQVRGSCLKLPLRIKYKWGGGITQFFPRARSFLVTPLFRGHASTKSINCASFTKGLFLLLIIYKQEKKKFWEELIRLISLH